jgi:hypothetical protein
MIQATLPRRSAPQIDLNQLAQQAMQPWADAFETWRSGVAALVQPTGTTTMKAGCGCPSCQSDPCQCNCCVSSADLVVEARLGEQRIVPVIIENHWRRERDITLELSSWTQPSADVTVTGAVVTPTTLTLAPCGQTIVVLRIDVGPTAPAPDPAGNNEQQRVLPDVSRCEVSYADLRITGCDLRSIRIAVAVMPRDCDAYTVDCDCACCC